MIVNFTYWAPFGLIQFYFLFSGREYAKIGGQNGGWNNYQHFKNLFISTIIVL